MVASLEHYLQKGHPSFGKDCSITFCSKSGRPLWELTTVQTVHQWSFIKVSRLYDQANSVKDLTDTPTGKSPDLLS